MSIRRRIKVETRDRKDVLAEAVISQDEFLEKFYANPPKFQFMFGAGMSESAGVPLAEDIVREIIVKVFEKMNPAKRGLASTEELREWVSREKWFNPNYEYISALEKEYPSTVLRTKLFRNYMRGRFPSPAQLMFAIGVKEGKLNNRCYTTNWDTLTEDAFYWLRGTNCTTIKGPDQLREVKDFEHRYVIKLHGDLDRYDVRYLREGMAKHHDDMREFLVDSLSGVGLVVIGYAGMEYSVMNMLMEVVHDHPDVLSQGLYWGYRGNLKQIPETITDLLAVGMDKGKDFRLFEADKADFLFDGISKKLEFNDIEDELANAFFRFNKLTYGSLRGRLTARSPQLEELVHRDLLDEGFLIRDYNAIHEVWKQDTKGMFRKKEEKERAARDAERKLVNHCYNDLKHENYADAIVKLTDVLAHFSENEAVHWGLGWAKYMTGEYQDAIKHYDDALALKPENFGTFVAKAMCYQALEKPAQEVEMYDKVLELKGNLDYIWFNRGIACHKMGDLGRELESYEAAAAANPSNFAAQYNLGLCYNENKQLLQAMNCFNRSVEINNKLFNALFNSGTLLGRLGQDVQAIRNFDACIQINQDDDESFKNRGIAEVMIGRYEEATESYGEYLSAQPEDAEAWLNYGLALYQCERYRESMEYTERYLTKHSDDARAWFNKGLILYAQKDRDGAMDAFNHSLSINDNYDMVWYRKALLLGELEQYDGEIELLSRFLKFNDQDDRAWFELGEANRKSGDRSEDREEIRKYYTAAISAYDRALDVQRTDVRVWLQKAICLNKLHRYDEAVECIKYLERYDKYNPEVYYQKGLALDGLDDQLASVDTLAETLKLDPDHEGAYYRRGILLAELEQYAKAVDHFDNVLRVNPDRWQAYHYKGVCVMNQKEYEKALDIFEEAAAKFKGQARFFVDQAWALVMMRDIDHAREKLRGALALDTTLKPEIEGTPEFSGLL